MRRILPVAGLAIWIAAATAADRVQARDAPSFDCAGATGSVEELVCTDAAFAALDRTLAESFAAAIAVARGLDVGAAETEAALRVVQRGWIKGRDDCWKAGDGLRDCVAAAYLRRESELVATFMLRAPVATTVWACAGNPANAVVTMFFDTTQPAIRFERGDSIDAGVLTPTASGSRYDGSFGRFIWIRGDEATYRDPDPDGTEMTCKVQP